MTDSYSAAKYAEQAGIEMDKKDCTSVDGKHAWKPQTPFYGMSQCSICKKSVYTK